MLGCLLIGRRVLEAEEGAFAALGCGQRTASRASSDGCRDQPKGPRSWRRGKERGIETRAHELANRALAIAVPPHQPPGGPFRPSGFEQPFGPVITEVFVRSGLIWDKVGRERAPPDLLWAKAGGSNPYFGQISGNLRSKPLFEVQLLHCGSDLHLGRGQSQANRQFICLRQTDAARFDLLQAHAGKTP